VGGSRIPHAIPHKGGQNTINYGEIKQAQLNKDVLLNKALIAGVSPVKQFYLVLKIRRVHAPASSSLAPGTRIKSPPYARLHYAKREGVFSFVGERG